jgi:hypothetical protein
MALNVVKKLSSTLLELNSPKGALFTENHILEPEFHQNKYVDPCVNTSNMKGAFQVGDKSLLSVSPHRGKQPQYANDEDDPSSLEYEGMMLPDGNRMDSNSGLRNVCALKSASIRLGYVDTSLARSVSREYYLRRKAKSGVKKHDFLVNSTGDGTIARVAVYPYSFPSVVDGHITIVRYSQPEMAWYVAAYLLSEDGQNQLYRYINGSSGQVELYPQDIARVWVKPADKKKISEISNLFENACAMHEAFYGKLNGALSKI